MEEEVEVLEETSTNKFLYSRLSEFRIAKKKVPTVVINGVPQEFRVIANVVLVCPECQSIITSFAEGADLVEISKMFAELTSEELKQLPNYCPNCGQKLKHNREIIDIKQGD